MKILAIRGRNLASLQGDFELDFAQTPLLGCGLFAITGETGAGKSTILDALCLALYGRYPRITGEGSKDKIENMQGERLHNSDPRSILRTGSAQGFAQADLVVDDQHLQATWEVRRAYGKADGNLMDFERSLVDLADGTVLASGKKRVEEEITKRLNLTYEQFGRTVLLAQNDFDAFLRASDTDRADLLERITGTELYSRISARAYEKERTAFRELQVVQQQTGFISVLPDKERKDLLALIQETQKSHAAHQKRMDEIRTDLEWFKRRNEARQQVEVAEKRAALAKQELALMAEQKQLLERLRRVEALRPRFERVRQAELRLAQLQDEHKGETEAQKKRRGELKTARTSLQERDKNLHQAQKKLSEAVPLFEQALALDAGIATLAQREGHASLLLKKFKKAGDKWRLKKRELHREVKEQRVEMSAVQEVLSSLSMIEPLVQRKQEVTDLFARLTRTDKGFNEARQRVAQAQSLCNDLDKRMQHDQQLKKKQRRELEHLRDAYQEKRQALTQARPDELRLRQEQKMELRAALDPLHHHFFLQVELQVLEKTLGKRREQAALEEDMARRKLETLEQQQRDLHSRAAEAEQALAQSQKVLSDAVLHLRVELEEDQPCPVCGARDHPGHDDAALGALLEEMRKRSAELAQELARNEQSKNQFVEQLATARARLLSIRDEQQNTQKKKTDLQNRTEDLFERARKAAMVLDLKIEVKKDSAGQLAVVEKVQKANEKHIETVRTKLATLRKLEQESSSLHERLITLEKAYDPDRGAQKKREIELERAHAQAAGIKLDFERLSERRENLYEQLLPLLQGVDLSRQDLQRDASSAERFLVTQIERFESHGLAQKKLGDRLAQFEKNEAVLEEKITQQQERIDEIQGELSVLQEQLGQQRERRNQLFDGRPVAQMRTKMEAEKERLTLVRQEVVDRLNELTTRLEVGKIKCAELEEAMKGERSIYEVQQAQLTKDLVHTGEPRQEVERLLSISAGKRDEIAGTYQKRLDEATRCAGILSDRQSHMQQFDEALAPKQSASELADRLKDLEGDLSMAMIELGKNNSQLELDDKARRQRARLSDKLKTVEKNHGDWALINEAIGSKDGARFRRFAQTVTLDHLIALANEQLRDINPRYIIERNSIGGLGLQVVDRDMAGEIRSVRSLSGGERFLISLALALGLSRLDGRSSYVDTLMIDEGFGALDARALDMVIEALESLQNQGRKVGVISHVEALTERIAVQVRVEKQGNGRSRVRTIERGFSAG